MAAGRKPGTPEFHEALNDAIFSTKELAGHEGGLQLHPASAYGVDEPRALVMVRLQNGVWTYMP